MTRPAQVTLHLNPDMPDGETLIEAMAIERLERLGRIIGSPVVVEQEAEAAGNVHGVPEGTIRYVYQAFIEAGERGGAA